MTIFNGKRQKAKISDYQKMPGLSNFNWGAFGFPVLWGLSHRCPLALLNIIPIFRIIFRFVTGFRANVWATKKNGYRDEMELARAQMPWQRLGVYAFLFKLSFFISFVIYIVVGFKS